MLKSDYYSFKSRTDKIRRLADEKCLVRCHINGQFLRFYYSDDVHTKSSKNPESRSVRPVKVGPHCLHREDQSTQYRPLKSPIELFFAP